MFVWVLCYAWLVDSLTSWLLVCCLLCDLRFALWLLDVCAVVNSVVYSFI